MTATATASNRFEPIDRLLPARYECDSMTQRKMPRKRTAPAERRLRRIEGGVSAIRANVQDLRVSLAPLVPHVGAIEGELHDVRSSLVRIERAVVRPTRRVAPSRSTRPH